MPIPLAKKVEVAEATSCRMMHVAGCPDDIGDEDITAYYAPLGTGAIEKVTWKRPPEKAEEAGKPTTPSQPHKEPQTTGLVTFRTARLLAQALQMLPPTVAGRRLAVQPYTPKTRADLAAEAQAKKLVAWYGQQRAAQPYAVPGQGLTPVQWPSHMPLIVKDFSHLLQPSSTSVAGAAEFQRKYFVEWKSPVSCPPPVLHASELGLGEEAAYRTLLGPRYERPFALQAQCWPALLRGLDLVAVSETSTGVALAALLPGIAHLKGQPPRSPRDGPAVLILAPSALACTQLVALAAAFPGLKVQGVHGPFDQRSRQAAEVLKGVDIVVGCPEPLLELCDAYCLPLQRASMLVLCGTTELLHNVAFEDRLRTLCSQIRPDRQMVLFAVAYSRGVERIVKEFMPQAARLHVRSHDEVGQNVVQDMQFYQTPKEAAHRLTRVLRRLETTQGTSRAAVLVESKHFGWDVLKVLQEEFPDALETFWDSSDAQWDRAQRYLRREPHARLVTSLTSLERVAAPDLDVVVVAEVPDNLGRYLKCLEYVGRSDRPGFAFTLLREKDAPMAYPIIGLWQAIGKAPPKLLLRFAKSFADPLLQKKDEAQGKKKKKKRKKKKKKSKKRKADSLDSENGDGAEEEKAPKKSKKRKSGEAADLQADAAPPLPELVAGNGDAAPNPTAKRKRRPK
eukprot:EG_transcript_4900